MASIAGSSITLACRPRSAGRDPAMIKFSGLKSASFLAQRKTLPSVRLQPFSFRVSCAAKPETLEKVCKIVKDQLALAKDATVTGESKFQALGADSLDTVEIVMGIEEAFDITLGEESANKITTVQDAADLVEQLVTEKAC